MYVSKITDFSHLKASTFNGRHDLSRCEKYDEALLDKAASNRHRRVLFSFPYLRCFHRDLQGVNIADFRRRKARGDVRSKDCARRHRL